MDGNTNVRLFRPRTGHTDSPITPCAFCEQVQQHLADITKEQNSLHYVHSLLRNKIGDIWEDQCEDFIALVRAISHPVYKFLLLISNTEAQPEITVPFSYSLVLKLHYMNKQINELIQLLDDFSTICRVPLAQTEKQQLKVADQMKKLSQSCDELHYKVHTFFDQIDRGNFAFVSLQ
ncbi:MAG TPA: hypothetical protein VFV38_01480 [Ktedonobacteraceae bacterium]|nr:hypothetical protein [Ktedonobacteraceae bacterium]